VRAILAVLASIWFVPVSCTTALGIGSTVFVDLDARDAAKGDSVHSSIAVVAVPPPAPERAFGHLLLGRVADYKEAHPEASFLMPAKAGRITPEEGTTVSYEVVAEAGGEQTIETRYSDGDRSAWGRYRASKREITPLASRLSVHDYLYSVTPYALLFAFIVYFSAWLARRRIPKITS
jgi:hypothetical protein